LDKDAGVASNQKEAKMGKRKKWINRVMVMFLVVFFASLPLQSSWGASKQIKLNFGTFNPPKGPLARAINWFVDEVERRTDNRVKMKIFWAGSLAKTMELPHAVRTGTADMALLVTCYFSDRFPSMAANLECMFLAPVTIGEGVEPYRKIFNEFPQVRNEYKKQNQKLLALFEYAEMGVISKKPIKTLADAKGVRIRAAGSILPKVFKIGGFIPTSIPSTEAYDAASRGVVDAIICSGDTGTKYKWYEVCKHFTRVRIIAPFLTYSINANLDVWNKLPSDIKDIIELTGNELTNRYPEWLIEADKNQHEQMKKEGVKYYEIPVADQKAWKAKLGNQLFEAYVKKIEKMGYPDARKMLERYAQLLRYKP